MDGQKPEIIEQTIAFWSQRLGKALSRQDAQQAVANVAGFFQVLAEWAKREELPTPNSDG